MDYRKLIKEEITKLHTAKGVKVNPKLDSDLGEQIVADICRKVVKNCSIPDVSHRLLRELRQMYLVNVDDGGQPKASIAEIMDLWDRVNRELQIVTID